MIKNNLFFLTKIRRQQFNLAIYLLTNNIVKYDEVPTKVPNLFNLPVNFMNYIKLPFFDNYLVGFTMAEGSFSIKSTGQCFFSVRQRNEENLFQAIKLRFSSTRKIGIDSKYIQFQISSKKDIKNVITFFDTHYPMLGYKAKQYKVFCDFLKINNKI